MKFNERLCWAVAGGVLMGIIIGLCISPLRAQDGNFGEITCTGLKVVGPAGRAAVVIHGSDGGGSVTILGGEDSESHVVLTVTEYIGGYIRVQSKDSHYVRINDDVTVVDKETGARYASLGTNFDGGSIRLSGNDGLPYVTLHPTKYGGNVSVWGRNKEAAASMRINPFGTAEVYVAAGEDSAGEDSRASMRSVSGSGAQISVNGKEGRSRMGINDLGGYVSVEGKDTKSDAVMSIDGHGGYVRVGGKDGGSMLDCQQ